MKELHTLDDVVKDFEETTRFEEYRKTVLTEIFRLKKTCDSVLPSEIDALESRVKYFLDYMGRFDNQFYKERMALKDYCEWQIIAIRYEVLGNDVLSDKSKEMTETRNLWGAIALQEN